jgi:hypothetical protein
MGNAASITPACPRCGYDQSGEVAAWTDRCPVESRCSECGRHFRWAVVFDPTRTTLRWSFEHARHPIGLIPRWFLTVAKAARPKVYWRSIGLATPTRPGRIVVFLVVWWLVVRAVLSIPIAGVVKLGLGAFPPGTSKWIELSSGWDPSLGWFCYHTAFGGGLRGLWVGGWWDTDDSLEVFFLSLWPVHLSIAWVLFTLVWHAGLIRRLHLTPHMLRAWLMSLLIFPVVHESVRLAVALGYLLQGEAHSEVILSAVLISYVSVSYWWSCAIKMLLPTASTRFFVYGHLAVILTAAVMHVIVVMLTESVLR